MKIYLLVNPCASSVSPSSQVSVSKMLSDSHDLEIGLTDGRGHAIELARQVAKSDAEVMVVLAGDGTLNEAANGLAGSDVALGVLPGGSTNVFSRTLGFEDDPILAIQQLLGALEAKSIQSINVGEANGRVFLFHLGAGFDAAVVERVERKSIMLKQRLSHSLFAYKALTTWLRHYDRTEPHFKVEFDGPNGEKEQVESYFAVCQNSDPYTYLGSRPFNLAPGDVGLDKKLAAVTATDLDASSILRMARKALFQKKGLEGVKNIDYRAGLDSFRIFADEDKPFAYQADGDYLGYTTELVFRHRPNDLNLVVLPKL